MKIIKMQQNIYRIFWWNRRKAGRKIFSLYFSIKETIAYNAIYEEKIHKNFSELDKAFGIKNLSEL